MLPLVLNPIHIKAGLAGHGAARDRRAAMLADAGVEVRLLPDTVPDALLKELQVLFVAGLPEGEAKELAGRARALGVLVNVEDVLPLCDFHVPAIVRRGELLLTASTGGQVPGLARALREHLADEFG
ncbi:MAG TPA: NAD(P)-dependent oxidoreductase, partial [Rhizomicrobium sp.]|nr:NAD(P)-dependent oxidoreductase [Rhizomicrobium sp.]